MNSLVSEPPYREVQYSILESRLCNSTIDSSDSSSNPNNLVKELLF